MVGGDRIALLGSDRVVAATRWRWFVLCMYGRVPERDATFFVYKKSRVGG